jgi:dTDP-4-dehydrorhamnose 3,5-epimerase
MKVTATAISDVKLIEPTVFGDERGFFLESWNEREFAAADIPDTFVQDNHSRSVRNVLRGLHYQIGQPQGKLVRVISGEVFDVAVDLRRSSPSFGKWVGATLSEENRRMAWIPVGFAHAFLVTSAVAEVLYKTTDYWAPELERTLAWDDSSVAINWPLTETPTLSEKDAVGARLADAETYA